MRKRVKTSKPSPWVSKLLAHFARSRLDAKAVEAMKITLVAADANSLCPVPVYCAKIPYFSLDSKVIEFHRQRTLEEWIPKGSDKPRKYTQPRGMSPRLYFAPLGGLSWEALAADPTAPLILVEGEVKAACACLYGFPTIGIGGVWNWLTGGGPVGDLDLIDWDKRPVYICFDTPDVRRNRNVALAHARLAIEMRRRGAKVRALELPANGTEKVGLDDFLVAQGASALATLIENAPEHLDRIAEMNAEYAIVTIGGAARVMHEDRRPDGTIELTFARPQDVRPLFAGQFIMVTVDGKPKAVNVFDYWMAHADRRFYRRIVFEPGRNEPSEYNLFRGFGVEPSPGDCSLFLAHVRDNICAGDVEIFSFVLRWLAHLFQKPTEIPGTALVLRGGHGTGKGIFVRAIGELVGYHFLPVSSTRHLLGQFNGHSAHAMLIFADEAFWGGDKSLEGALKTLITEPTRMIEHKGKDAIKVNSYLRVIFATNNAWPVYAGVGERRFLVIDVADTKKQDTAYFGAIQRELESGGYAALMHHLMNVDLTGFDVRRVPRTAALMDVMTQGFNSVTKFWYDCLVKGENAGPGAGWQTKVPCAKLHGLYADFAKDLGLLQRAIESELGKALLKFVPGLIARKETVNSKMKGPGVAAKQERVWIFPSLEEARAGFAAELNIQGIDWGGD